MAVLASLDDLKNRALRRADMVSSSFISDTPGGELELYVQEAGRALYDLILKAYGEDYYYSSTTETTTAGDNTISLPSDFYKLLGVDASVPGYSDPLTLTRYNWNERNNLALDLGWNWSTSVPRYRIQGGNLTFYPTPQGEHSVTIHYVPAMTAIDNDTNKFDGINGWDEYIVLAVAIKCLVKEESDTSQLELELAKCVRRIEDMAPARDIDKPLYAVDVMASANWDWEDI